MAFIDKKEIPKGKKKCRTGIGSFKNINSTNSFGGKDKVL